MIKQWEGECRIEKNLGGVWMSVFISVSSPRNDTLWSTLNELAIINTNEFAELFAKMASPAKRKPLSEAYDKTAKAKKV